MIKNTGSQKIGCQMVSATDGSAFTGSVTVSVTGDAGTQATGSVGSGACTHEGNGYHTYAPAQAETNYDLIAFTFTGTGAVPATVQVFTVNAKLTATAISNMEIVYVTDFATAYNTTTDGWNVNTTHWGGTAVASANVLIDGAITAAKIATNAIDADALAADAVTEIQSGLATAAELAKVPKSDSNVTWNATALASINAEADTAISDAGLATAANLATVAGYIDTEVASILAAVDTEIATIVTHLTDIKGAGWTTTDTLEAIRDRGDAAWVTATGFSTHSAADVWAVATRSLTVLDEDSTTLDLDATIRAAVGLAIANIDTQIADLPTNAELATAITSGLTTALTEGYRGTGATGSVRDLLYEIIAHMGESSISSTTKTLKKLDGSTAKTYTLDSATTPTSITEAT